MKGARSARTHCVLGAMLVAISAPSAFAEVSPDSTDSRSLQGLHSGSVQGLHSGSVQGLHSGSIQGLHSGSVQGLHSGSAQVFTLAVRRVFTLAALRDFIAVVLAACIAGASRVYILDLYLGFPSASVTETIRAFMASTVAASEAYIAVA